MATAIRIERRVPGYYYTRSDELTGDEARTLAEEINGIEEKDELELEDLADDKDLAD